MSLQGQRTHVSAAYMPPRPKFLDNLLSAISTAGGMSDLGVAAMIAWSPLDAPTDPDSAQKEEKPQ